MEKLPIYCELSFYTNFLEMCPKDEIGSDKKEQWDFISKMIHSNSKIYIDASIGEIKELAQKTKFLYKNVFNGNGVELKPGQFPEQFDDNFFQKVNPHSIFFIKDKNKYSKYQKKYGMWFIAVEDLFKCKITKRTKKTLSTIEDEEDYSGWNELLHDLKHPCNSMIISDNYILDNNDDLEENLWTILRIMLPQELTKNRFHLTIITDSKSDIRKKYKLLTQEIKKIRSSYNIDLKIVNQSRAKAMEVRIHDRYILTNYLCIFSGYGFNLFKGEKIKKTTRLTFDFISDSNTMEEMAKLIKHFRKIEEITKNVEEEIVVMPEEESGKLTTRLLSYKNV